MARNKVVSATLVEIVAEDGHWLYNEAELGRNFVHAVTLGKDEPRSHWVECTNEEKEEYEREQAELLGKDTDTTEGTMNNPIPFHDGDYVEQGLWYLDEDYGLVECIKSGYPRVGVDFAEYLDLPPM